jgi:hypothetical protein
MSERFDVAIIGAGPAGTLAAALLEARGFRVRILERCKFPRFVIGESLLPSCMAYLEGAGLLEHLSRQGYQVKPGVGICKGDKEISFAFEDQFSEGWTYTFQVQRASFVDHRADIYSLGMCFYNMVTGRYAFDSDSFTEVLMAICTQPLPSLGLQCPSLPPQVVSWFERCCARDPNARFQSAEEAFSALRTAAESAVPSNDHDETLRGHRAPLSQRSPPLGTTDSASYPGADASHRVVSPAPKRRSAMALGVVGVTLVAAIGAIALVRLASGGEPHPASSAMAMNERGLIAPSSE